MALWFLFSFLTVTFGEVSAERFDEYVKDAQREEVFTQTGNDRLRAAVKEVEEQNEDKVVLYHVLPLNGYLMAWLVHGITSKESLQWQNTPGVSAELNFSLRHFEPGMSFPSFTRHNASLCFADWNKKVREADPNTAKVLGDGEWSNYFGFRFPYKITYSTTSKEYDDCQALVYSELVEDNNKNGPLLEERALANAHVNTAKQFAEYLDDKVGEKWQDTPFPSELAGMTTVGVQDRLLDAQINLLGRAALGSKQDRTPSMWAHFTFSEWVYDDLNADHVAQSIWPDFGDRARLLDQVLDSYKLSPAKLQKVSNLLSLLRCAAQMRFPIYQANFHRRTEIMKHCWEGDRQPFPPDLPLMSLDDVASKRTKDATSALQTGGLPTQEETRGFSRVLLQVVLPKDVANDLAYVSTDWLDKTGPPPGHQHKDWKGVSFMDAYKVLKNTAKGDKVTARVLVKRDWSLAPPDTTEPVKIIATSMVFADPDFMEFAASVLEDIRNYVLQQPINPNKKKAVWPSWVLELKVVVPVLCLGLLACLGYIGYRRSSAQAQARDTATRDVELRLA